MEEKRINAKQLEQIDELEKQLAELKKRYDNVGKPATPKEPQEIQDIDKLEELEEIDDLEEIENAREVRLTETPKSPEILAVEREAKRNGIVTLSFEEELSPMEKKIVGVFKKIRKPKKKEEKPNQPENLDAETPMVFSNLMPVEEKKYTQEIEEEPLLEPFEEPIRNIDLFEKTLHKPQERQIQQEKPQKFEKNDKFLEKEDLASDIILLQPYESFIKICPLCNKKVKKYSVKRKGVILTQLMKCKNKNCTFEKEIVIQI